MPALEFGKLEIDRQKNKGKGRERMKTRGRRKERERERPSVSSKAQSLAKPRWYHQRDLCASPKLQIPWFHCLAKPCFSFPLHNCQQQKSPKDRKRPMTLSGGNISEEMLLPSKCFVLFSEVIISILLQTMEMAFATKIFANYKHICYPWNSALSKPLFQCQGWAIFVKQVVFVAWQ